MSLVGFLCVAIYASQTPHFSLLSLPLSHKYTGTIFNTRVVGEYVLFGGVGAKKKEADPSVGLRNNATNFFSESK